MGGGGSRGGERRNGDGLTQGDFFLQQENHYTICCDCWTAIPLREGHLCREGEAVSSEIQSEDIAPNNEKLIGCKVQMNYGIEKE